MSFSSTASFRDVPSAEALARRVDAARKRFSNSLALLAYTNAPPALLRRADLVGDAETLLRFASETPNDSPIRRVVVCAQRYLAESIDVLFNEPRRRAQRNGRRVDVFIPFLYSGCSVAEMASTVDLENCWSQLESLFNPNEEVLPIATVASTTSAKAFCGARGGFVCTSKNVRQLLDLAFEQRSRVLFFPDSRLGRNAGYAIGLKPSDVAVWNHRNPTFLAENATFETPLSIFCPEISRDGGPSSSLDSVTTKTANSPSASLGFENVFLPAASNPDATSRFLPFGDCDPNDLLSKRLILWNGFCPVARRVGAAQITRLKARNPEIRVALLPSCDFEAAEFADFVGSQDEIEEQIAASPLNSSWAVGADVPFIRRIAQTFPTRTIVSVAASPQLSCEDPHLFSFERVVRVLESLDAPTPFGRVCVPDYVATPTALAFERMFLALIPERAKNNSL